MSNLNFRQYVELEQIRHIETAQPLSDSAVLETPISTAQTLTNFESCLRQRAITLIRQHQLSDIIVKPVLLHKRMTLIAGLLMMVFGILAAMNALTTNVSTPHSLNVYWLLLVLIGFNLLSISLWILGNLANLSSLIGGSFSQIATSLFRYLPASQSPATTAWFECHYTRDVGVWQLSRLNHSLWLLYLSGGLMTLLLLFTVKQYNFYWGSTLLSDQHFTQLTHLLTSPLQAIGIHTPNSDALHMSRLIHSELASLESRRQWAYFLLGSVFLYGFIPRLLCWLLSCLMLQKQKRQYKPDFYLPYYMQLRHTLLPSASSATVIDPAPQPLTSSSSNQTHNNAYDSDWPIHSIFIGIELRTSSQTWPSINIMNQALYKQALLQLQSEHNKPVALIVDMQNVPDRGIQRQMNTLLSKHKPEQRWLLILESNTLLPDDRTQRLNDWYRAAQSADIPANHIHTVQRDTLDQHHPTHGVC